MKNHVEKADPTIPPLDDLKFVPAKRNEILECETVLRYPPHSWPDDVPLKDFERRNEAKLPKRTKDGNVESMGLDQNESGGTRP